MRYLIVGNGAAGNAAAAAIRARDPAGEVLILSDEPDPAYYRPLIPELIEDGSGQDSLFRDELTRPQGAEVRLGVRVTDLKTREKSLSLDSGESLSYDRLLLATGSAAVRLNLPGLEGPGVFGLRTISDARALRAAAQEARQAVVLGGGRVGMKAALALRERGLTVALVEKLNRIVPLQFDQTAGQILGRAVEAQGIELNLEQSAREVEREGGRVRGVVLADGRRLAADLIVVAVGVQPNLDLARAAGLKVDQGLVVDEDLKTSAPDVFAAGDVVETTEVVSGKRVVSGTWTNAVEMGRMAGENMAGGKAVYPGAWAVLNSLELAGVPTVSVGLVQPPDKDGYEVLTARRGETYRKLVLKEGRLVGALLVGEVEGAGVLTGLIKRRAEVGPEVEALMARRPSYAPWLKWEGPEAEAFQG